MHKKFIQPQNSYLFINLIKHEKFEMKELDFQQATICKFSLSIRNQVRRLRISLDS